MEFRKEARDHVVTFRLTKAEYERLKAICETGASSMSDAARAAVLALAPEMTTGGAAEITLDRFDEKLDRIIHLLGGLQGSDAC